MISVIVPVYKTEKYLRQCVDSLVNQTEKELEIILVDDGSPDKCPSVCDEYAKKYDNIKSLHKENGGSVSARKFGLMHAHCDYVTFVDSDDWVEENYFEEISSVIKKYQPDIYASTGFTKAENGNFEKIELENKIGLYDRARLENELFPKLLYTPPFFNFGVMPSLWSKVIKRTLLEDAYQNVPENVRMGDDLMISLPCALMANSIYFGNTYGYYYRQNPVSITHSYDRACAERIAVLLETLRNKTKEFDLYDFDTQISAYAIYMTEFTVVSLVKGSDHVQRDLGTLDCLWRDPSVRRVSKLKIPIKTKLILLLAKSKLGLVFNFYRWLKY